MANLVKRVFIHQGTIFKSLPLLFVDHERSILFGFVIFDIQTPWMFFIVMGNAPDLFNVFMAI